MDSGQIHKPYCSIKHWSIWGSIQLHCLHNWSRPLCCGKHFTRLASILINSLLLIMYLIDQFGPRVNWSIILIFFFFCRGIKWGANCSELNVYFACSLGYCNELPNDLRSSGVMRYHSKYGVLLNHDTNAKRQGLSVLSRQGPHCIACDKSFPSCPKGQKGQVLLNASCKVLLLLCFSVTGGMLIRLYLYLSFMYFKGIGHQHWWGKRTPPTTSHY